MKKINSLLHITYCTETNFKPNDSASCIYMYIPHLDHVHTVVGGYAVLKADQSRVRFWSEEGPVGG